MAELGWPDNHHFDAAVGWLTLGNKDDARAELEALSKANRSQTEVLALEWRLLAAERRWEEAAEVAEKRLRKGADQPEAWIERSYALHEIRRTREALDKLLPAATLFPKVSTISYNLACYTCQLGETAAARRWLKKALHASRNPSERKLRILAAQQDRDLEPLWGELKEGRFG